LILTRKRGFVSSVAVRERKKESVPPRREKRKGGHLASVRSGKEGRKSGPTRFHGRNMSKGDPYSTILPRERRIERRPLRILSKGGSSLLQ